MKGLPGQTAESFVVYHYDLLSFKFGSVYVVLGQEIVLCFVFPYRDQRLVLEFLFRHKISSVLFYLFSLVCPQLVLDYDLFFERRPYKRMVQEVRSNLRAHPLYLFWSEYTLTDQPSSVAIERKRGIHGVLLSCASLTYLLQVMQRPERDGHDDHFFLRRLRAAPGLNLTTLCAGTLIF